MPEVPTQPQPTSNQKSINWKRVLIVVVIGAAVIGLGVLIFLILQPKPETTSIVTTNKATPSAKISTPSAEKDETADWETYENKENKYSIRYPKSWSLDEISDKHIRIEEDTKKGLSTPEIGLSISKDPQKGPVYTADLYSDLRQVGITETYKATTPEYPTYVVKRLPDTLVDGVTFIKYEWESKDGGPYSFGVITMTKGFYYWIFLEDSEKFTPNYLEIFNNVLTTFKFLD